MWTKGGKVIVDDGKRTLCWLASIASHYKM